MLDPEDKLDLMDALRVLHPRELRAVQLWLTGYGLADIAKRVFDDVSAERARQLLVGIFGHLRKHMTRQSRHQATELAAAIRRAQVAAAVTEAAKSIAARMTATDDAAVAVASPPPWTPPTPTPRARCVYPHCPTPNKAVSRPRNIHAACLRLQLCERMAERRARARAFVLSEQHATHPQRG